MKSKKNRCLIVVMSMLFGVLLVSCDKQGEFVDDRQSAPENSNISAQQSSGELDENSDNDQGKGSGDDVKQWLGERIKHVAKSGNDAAQAAGDAASGSLDWANDTYEQLKKQGLTSANSASQWVTEDFRSMGAWEYKVATIPLAESNDAVEVQLNELGLLRWECYQVTAGNDGANQNYYFKRTKKSYLKSIPMKDLLKLVPLMDGQ